MLQPTHVNTQVALLVKLTDVIPFQEGIKVFLASFCFIECIGIVPKVVPEDS